MAPIGAGNPGGEAPTVTVSEWTAPERDEAPTCCAGKEFMFAFGQRTEFRF